MSVELPSELAESLRLWGPRWFREPASGRDAMVKAWAPHANREDGAGYLARDISYGPSPRQVLDIVVFERHADDLRPVLVFVHGGAFIRGNKEEAGHLYGNVPRDFARHGHVAVNVEYRLAPEAPWPHGAEDVADAVRWVAANIERFGGDPQRIVLMGHSAGCAHCASAAWDERVWNGGPLPLRALVLLSPRVDANLRPTNHNADGVEAYYGTRSEHADRIPLNKVRPDAPPTFVAWAEFENPRLDVEAALLAQRLVSATERGGPPPRIVQLADHNHTSVIAQFDTPFNDLGSMIRRWLLRFDAISMADA